MCVVFGEQRQFAFERHKRSGEDGVLACSKRLLGWQHPPCQDVRENQILKSIASPGCSKTGADLRQNGAGSAGGFWGPYLSYMAIGLGYALVAGSLVSFVEPLAGGSGIPEVAVSTQSGAPCVPILGLAWRSRSLIVQRVTDFQEHIAPFRIALRAAQGSGHALNALFCCTKLSLVPRGQRCLVPRGQRCWYRSQYRGQGRRIASATVPVTPSLLHMTFA